MRSTWQDRSRLGEDQDRDTQSRTEIVKIGMELEFLWGFVDYVASGLQSGFFLLCVLHIMTTDSCSVVGHEVSGGT